MLNGGAIRWRSGKKSVVAQSSMESEYIASCEASNEVHWLKKFVIELGVFPSCTDPVSIYCDNTGAIANVKEPRTHSTAKHILGHSILRGTTSGMVIQGFTRYIWI